ncbi:MAG: hypothetical protein KC619_26225 [Myxococcales bacterium]|nr:hypothetical protein [Myxococcales bacterium]
MRALLLIAIAALGVSGCILDRSGTAPGRQDPDATVGRDAGGATDGGGTAVDAARPGVDAGVPGECSSGDGRMVPCGGCGTQAQTCAAGTWVPAGECIETPLCMPGMTEDQPEACGMCGTHTRTRSCLGCDGWSDWGAYGVCTGEGVCSPGATHDRTESCACGTGARTITETCRGDCAWETSNTGSCSQRLCSTIFGDVCPNERRTIGCASEIGLRTCRCDGNTGNWVDCDRSC